MVHNIIICCLKIVLKCIFVFAFLRQHRKFRHIWNQLVKHSKMYFILRCFFIVYDIAGMISIWSRYILNLPVEVFMLGISTGFITSTQVISYIITHHKVFWNLFWVVLAVNEVIFTNSNRVRANRKKVTQIRIIHYFRIPKFVEKKCYWSEILSNSFIYVTKNVSKYQIRVS